MAEKIISDYGLAGSIDPIQDLFLGEQFSSSSYKSYNRNIIMGVTGQPADISTAQNITNKTLNNTNILLVRDDRFTLQDNVDTSKQAVFQLSGITTATTRTYTLPNASSTLADIATAQTLTNKTLTSPVITGGSITNSTVSVDTIAEFTVANGVTIDGMNIKDGKLNTNNSVVTSNITDSAVTPAKLVAGTGSSWNWQAWTPSYSNITLGNGTLKCSRWTQIGKTVFVQWYFTLGGSSSVGTAPTLSLPVAADTSFAGGIVSPIGNASYDDASVNNYVGYVVLLNTTTLSPRCFVASGTYALSASLTSAIPFTWGTADIIGFSASYEAA